MTLTELFNKIDILDLTNEEIKEEIIKNKAVRADYDFDKLYIYLDGYRKYMNSDEIITLSEFSKREGIYGDRLGGFIRRYDLDTKPKSFRIQLAMEHIDNFPNKTIVEIAKEFGCSAGTLYKYRCVKNRNSLLRAAYLEDRDRRLMLAYELYMSGKCSKTKAEREYKVYKGSISRHIEKLKSGGHEHDKREERVQIQSSNGIKNGELHNGHR